ncbi:MAG: hypothetical protein IKI93_18075 [Clostridia bacterium]|nr:hypothetical protein [Clostridia bacterium]
MAGQEKGHAVHAFFQLYGEGILPFMAVCFPESVLSADHAVDFDFIFAVFTGGEGDKVRICGKIHADAGGSDCIGINPRSGFLPCGKLIGRALGKPQTVFFFVYRSRTHGQLADFFVGQKHGESLVSIE